MAHSHSHSNTPTEKPSGSDSHFKGKDAISHVAEAQAEGIISSVEVHGTEVPGHITAAADTARDTALALLLVGTLLIPLQLGVHFFYMLLAFSGGWVIWKAGRSALLGWARLERLHRVLEQEKWEIEHNRAQERAELKVLYAAKGFEGRLLEDVLDVLMADGDRLLKVMVEEELGLSLHTQEHPLKQSLGAFVGGVISALCVLLSVYFIPSLWVLFGTALFVMALSGAILAYKAQNRLIPAIVWHVALGVLSFSILYFLWIGEYERT
jgi:hypothetical protein